MEIPLFQYIAPPLRLFSGPDSLGLLGRELDRLGCRRAVIFCGSSLARDGALDPVRAALGERCAGLFAGVRAHSPVPDVQAGAAELRQRGADAVIAVGGGSAIVSARAASILLAEAGEVRALATSRDGHGALRSPRLLAPKLPQLVIPTTPTTAMVKAGSAIFDPATHERLALFDPKTRAQAIFIHPALAATAPRALVVSASLDTLSGALEGLASRGGNPLTDSMLMHALRLLARHLPAQAQGDDPCARGELMLAAILCGQGTEHSGGGIATVLGHAIGARHAVENGITKAIVLPHVLRFNAEAAASGLAKIGAALGLPGTAPEPLVARVIATLEAIFRALSLPRRLRDVGVDIAILPDIAEKAMGDWFLRGNPRPVREAVDLEQILKAAW
ncbi:MAG: iron-containing alcohol dehydrogenase [Acetobacteraceae bacterium]|nr:iron-containing alcohol dehydrogenase [Acetobacteraceae bacterium]